MQEAHLFGLPQRLNSLGYLINILKTFVKIIKQLFFFIAYMVYKHRDIIFSKYVWIIILGLLLLVAIIALVNFRTFKYYVDEEAEEFVVQKGLFNKSKVVIKFANILQVNITQNIVQKALSLYGLTLDTAGSDKVEVDLYALDGFHATALKKLLLSKIHGEQQKVSTEETDILAPTISSDKTVLSLPAKNILLVSLFSNYRQGLALFFAFLVTMFQNFKDAIETFELSDEDIDTAAVKELALASIFTLVIIVLIGLMTIPFIINLVRYYIKYYNFSIVKNITGNFSMQYGLFNKVNTIFNREKIQFITFKQNQILKHFGIGILSLKQLVTNAAKEDKSSIVMPGIVLADRDKVYELAFPDPIFENTTELKPRIGLLINLFIKMLFFFGLLGIALYYIEFDTMLIYPAFLILLLATTIYNYLFYKNYRLIYNDNFIVKRYGVWNEKEMIIPMARVQGVGVSQTIFQQQSSTANLNISTAAKGVSFRFFPDEEVNQIANNVLYKIEK